MAGVSRDMEWTNLNLQDILPTWQWWVQSADENRLELDWDYGPKFFRYVNGEEDHFNYTQIGPLTTAAPPWPCTARWPAARQ